MKSFKPPIIVTGSHRSGSTWVGRVLATAPELFYVHEPLNPSFAPYYFGDRKLPWFIKIGEQESAFFQTHFDALLTGGFPPIALEMLAADRYLRYRLWHSMSFRLAYLRKRRFLLKDPFALFSIEWFATQFGAQSLVLLRQPLAFVNSLKKKGWAFDFNEFLYQPELMDGALKSFSVEIQSAAKSSPSLVEQGCLLWNCITARILELSTQSGCVVCRYEALNAAPDTQFPKLFDRLGLTWTSKSARFIDRYRRINLNEKKQQRLSWGQAPALASNLDKLTIEEQAYVAKKTEMLTEQAYGHTIVDLFFN